MEENHLFNRTKNKLEAYLTEMVEINGHKMHAISCMPDHSHLLISWNPDFSIDDLVTEIKQLSKHFISFKKWNIDFDWQEGYGGFGLSKSDVPAMTEYINYQQTYHKTKSFKNEFEALLQRNEIEYQEKDLFEFYD